MSWAPRKSPSSDGWYVITTDRRLALRVRSGLRLGEDARHQLSLEPADGQVALEISPDGALALRIESNRHRLYGPSPLPTQRVHIPLHTRAEIQFANNAITVDNDFAGTAGQRQTLHIQVVEVDRPLRLQPDPEPEPAPAPGSSQARPALGALAAVIVTAVLIALGAYSVSMRRPDEAPLTERPPAPQHSSATAIVARVQEPGSGDAAETDVSTAANPVITAPAVSQDTPVPRARLETERAEDTGGSEPVDAAPAPPPASARRVQPDVRSVGDAGAGPGPTDAVPAIAEPGPVDAALAIEADLRAAQQAFDAGRLMPPATPNAFGLYRRVLATAPDSVRAGNGLRAVHEALLSRTEAFLEAEDVAAALATLDAAVAAGADQTRVDRLKAEASYRRHVLEARTGEFTRLYHLADLQAVQRDPPAYPRFARRGVDAEVELQMTISENGDVTDIEVLGTPPKHFVEPARRAVAQWRFEPVRINGKPVPVRTSVRLVFRG